MKKVFFMSFLFFFLFSISIISSLFYWLNSSPYRIEKAIYEVKEGSSLSKIAYELSREKIIQWPKIFIFYAKLKGEAGSIQAGTYEFEPHLKPKQILDKMVNGDVLLTTITIAEGLNIWQIAEKLTAAFPNIPGSVWLPYMKSKHLIAKLEFQESLDSLEGFLFPNTYHINPSATPDVILTQMINEFKKHFKKELIESGKNYNLTALQVVTLASLIEKETALAVERSHVSAVYLNRLRIGMRLQADPTVIYGMWPTYTGKISKKDLQSPHLYNTYVHLGMPPGPICSPGQASLEAAVNPLKTSDLYFVAKGDGSHFFSANLADHNKAVQEYISFLRQEKNIKNDMGTTH
ncbi:MAG: endolytic transglycosylase MltG [Silvanigrellaceae bacterium]|nr:endolytic transglycosylase MltG [Silvanigrellaceae bacterium]